MIDRTLQENTAELKYTIFKDVKAQSIQHEQGSWNEICDLIADEPSRSEKNRCRLLKLAHFGDVRTKKGALRHNDNVLSITGVEGDHDTGEIQPDDVVAKLETHGIKALVYTSWSHTAEMPKWRVLAPLSCEVQPEERLKFVRALNGMLDGVLARESEDLHLAYYFGSPQGAERFVRHTFNDPEQGVFLDQIEKLDDLAMPCTRTKGGDVRAKPEATPLVRAEGCRLDPHQTLTALTGGEDFHGNTRGLVAHLVAKGVSDQEIRALFEQMRPQLEQSRDRERVDTLLGDELQRLIDGAREKGFDLSKWGPLVAQGFSGHKDVRNAHIFGQMWRDRLLFVYESGDTLVFSEDLGWVKPKPEFEMVAAREVVQYLHDQARELYRRDQNADAGEVHSEAVALCQLSKLRNMVELAKSESGMTVRLCELDADPYLIGLQNGVFNLQTMSLIPPTPDLKVTKRASVAYAPTARAPRWERFLAEVLPDDEVRAFVHRLFGYTLLGKVEEEIFPFLLGSGKNGKTTLIETVGRVLGDYAKKARTDLVMRTGRGGGEGAEPEKVALKGSRFVYMNETSESSRLDEATTKDLTGGDTVTARDLYSKPISFLPSHTLFMVGNHRPEIHDDSFGMWRRVALIEFDVTVPAEKRDVKLKDKLWLEREGIFNWLVEGYRQYCEHGLAMPERINAATELYREDMDILGEFLNDAYEVSRDDSDKVPRSEVYFIYEIWAKRNGHSPMSAKKLSRRLNDRGVARDAGKRNYLGLRRRATNHVVGLPVRRGEVPESAGTAAIYDFEAAKAASEEAEVVDYAVNETAPPATGNA